MKHLEDNLSGTNNNCLHPFFWQHGESLEIIQDYIEQMKSAGIGHMCIESRPHPGFLESGWWQTLDFILQQAEEKGMNVWILDDARFPTGYANGKVPERLKKKYLNVHQFDIVGTSRHMDLSVFPIVSIIQWMNNPLHQQDRPVKVLMAEKKPGCFREVDYSTLKDITEWLDHDTVHLQLEKKHYAVFVLYETRVSQEPSTNDYLDPMNPEATDILLQEVYEQHWDHFKDHFGKTMTGFFSDEPRFGNAKGPHHIIGQSDMPLPFNEEVKRQLEEAIAPEEWIYLFQADSPRARAVRSLYMDIVSSLYSKHFSQRIGAWCQAHEVSYFGHVIEDNNAHERLGYGPGHYFRAMAGMDAAGIDIIGGQVVPGMDYHHDAYSTGGSDGQFYHHLLIKLAQSCARLDPKKQGRVMCEAFGAYGWIEGLKMMKWITDFMVVNGVNCIVPHAFDPKEFPDWDCPPHFYAHGYNPQFPYFKKWSAYANRLCHLFSQGDQVCSTGILYDAFSEWNGSPASNQTIVQTLQSHQIDANIISEDWLQEAVCRSGSYIINNHAFTSLTIPSSIQLPQDLLLEIERIAKEVPVYFIDQKPAGYQGKGEVVQLEQLAKILQQKNAADLLLSEQQPALLSYTYQQPDGLVRMFFNTSVLDSVDTWLTLPDLASYVKYDAMENSVHTIPQENGAYHLQLAPYQSLVLVQAGNRIQAETCAEEMRDTLPEHRIASWEPTLIKAVDFRKEAVNDLHNLERFSGTLFYADTILLDSDQMPVLLEIEDVDETVHITVNSKDCGSAIAPPYRFSIADAVQPGANVIEIETVNTLARALRDPLSIYIPMAKPGISGTVHLYGKKGHQDA